MPNVFKARFSSSGPHEKKLDLEVIQVCFAQTAALGGFCAEGWATGEETYGLSEWRSRRKLCSQYNIATERKFRECKRCGAVRCRAVSCRAVSCRAVPCRACVRACMRTQWNSVLKMMYRLPRRDDHHKMWFSKRFLGTWDYSLTRAEQKMCV